MAKSTEGKGKPLSLSVAMMHRTGKGVIDKKGMSKTAMMEEHLDTTGAKKSKREAALERKIGEKNDGR